MRGIEVRAVRRYAVECHVDDCCWDQEHLTRTDAEADGARHLAEWHSTPASPEHRPVVDLMVALEASLAAVKAKRP